MPTPPPNSAAAEPADATAVAEEDFADSAVPEEARIGRTPLMMAWYGVVSAIFYVYFGALVASLYGVTQALIGVAVTIVIYSVINKVISQAAIESGLNVALFSRGMFGHIGAAIATLIFAATAIYYFVFEGSVIAAAFQQYFGGSFTIWALAVCVVGFGLILGSISKFIDKYNGFLLPFYLIGMVVACVIAVSQDNFNANGFGDAPAVTSGMPGWLATAVLYMGIWVLMMFTMDFARLGKKEDTGFHGIFTFGPLFYTLAFGGSMVIGILLSKALEVGAGETGPAFAIVQLMGFAGVLLIFITQSRINTANLYLASTNLEAFFARLFGLRLPRIVWGVVAAAISFVLMISGDFLANVVSALTYQGVFITAWVAIALVHIGFHRARKLPFRWTAEEVPLFNVGGMLAWIIPVAIGLYLTIDGGAAPSTLQSLAPVITAGLAAIAYAVVCATTLPKQVNA